MSNATRISGDANPPVVDNKINFEIEKSQKIFERLSNKKWGIIRSSIIFYVLPWLILTLYTGKACPFVDKNFVFDFLNNLLLQVALSLFIISFPLYFIRTVIAYSIGKERLLGWSDLKYGLFEGSFFLIWTAILFTIGMNMDILLESVMKITIGPFVLGFFSTFNLILVRKGHLYAKGLRDKKQLAEIDGFSYMSLRTKFIIVTTGLLLLVGIVIALVSLKNFFWLVHSYDNIVSNLGAGVASVFKEIIFIISVFIGFMIITIVYYTTNIKLIFVLLNNSIYNILKGDLDLVSIPFVNDEFGLMGEHIIHVSSEMEEKKKIANAFGKVVSPKVAEIIMDSGIEKRGALKNIVILFTDIRGFTSITNKSDPEELVESLNNYFTELVDIVEEKEGLVDKFIGDALMSLFGYDDWSRGVNNAVAAAFKIQKHLYSKSDNKFKTGVGIASGDAVVGLMGSPNRLDFTAIGKTVNMAARLESATAKYGYDIIVDQKVLDNLDPEYKKYKWHELEVEAKGFEQKVKAYGIKIQEN